MVTRANASKIIAMTGLKPLKAVKATKSSKKLAGVTKNAK